MVIDDHEFEIKELVDINFEETIPISSKQILWRKRIVSWIANYSKGYPPKDIKLKYVKSLIKVYPILKDNGTANGYVS